MFDKHKLLDGINQALYVLEEDCTKEQLLKGFIAAVKDALGLDAVGIRLREGDDYPYYTTIGFTEAFVKAEMSLCELDASGRVKRDPKGLSCLDCMCGDIIRGRTDPKQPFFTPGGSFCSTGTSKLLASTTPDQRQARTRNRCNGEGYESVCLVPIHDKDETIGLLQVNARREGAFDEELAPFLEGVCDCLGEVLGPLMEEEAKSRKLLAGLESSVSDLSRKISQL